MRVRAPTFEGPSMTMLARLSGAASQRSLNRASPLRQNSARTELLRTPRNPIAGARGPEKKSLPPTCSPASCHAARMLRYNTNKTRGVTTATAVVDRRATVCTRGAVHPRTPRRPRLRMARIVRRPCVVPRRFNSLEPNFYETLGSPECPKSLGVLLLAAFMM